MTEALGRVLRFAFDEMKVNRVSAEYFSGNGASGRVMVKNGLQYEGTARQAVRKEGKYVDSVHYAVLADDFFHQTGGGKSGGRK